MCYILEFCCYKSYIGRLRNLDILLLLFSLGPRAFRVFNQKSFIIKDLSLNKKLNQIVSLAKILPGAAYDSTGIELNADNVSCNSNELNEIILSQPS